MRQRSSRLHSGAARRHERRGSSIGRCSETRRAGNLPMTRRSGYGLVAETTKGLAEETTRTEERSTAEWQGANHAELQTQYSPAIRPCLPNRVRHEACAGLSFSASLVSSGQHDAETRLSIGEVARLVGFRTPSHFTTAFRRMTGIAPSEYRSRWGHER